MEFIKKKLDNGKYIERVKKIQQNKSNNQDEFQKLEDNPINNRIDNDIMEDVQISSIDPLSDSEISEISVEDINIDKDLPPVKNFSNDNGFLDVHDVQIGGINKNKYIDDLTESISNILYTKISKKEILGKREIKKKL